MADLRNERTFLKSEMKKKPAVCMCVIPGV